MKKIIGRMALILFLTMFISACTGDKGQVENQEKNPTENQGNQAGDQEKDQEKASLKKAPDFELEDYDGNIVKLSDLEGQKIYIKFWASWCGPCVKGLADLEEISKMEDKGFQVYSIVTPGIGREKSKEDFKTWYEKEGYEGIKILFDESGEILSNYQIRAFPTTAIINSKLELAAYQAGSPSNEKIIEFMETID